MYPVSYGAELELGDVDRMISIPPELGKWDYSEIDLYNVYPPYRYRAVDPLGVDPPVGGEINTVPSRSIEGLLDVISRIYSLFPRKSNPITSHFHVHVHVPGLTKDITLLHRLARFVGENQEELVKKVYNYQELKAYKYTRSAKRYLKLDGGLLIPSYMVNNILEKTNTFKQFIDMHAMGKDGKSRGRPFRYAVNMYSLKHTQTIEFRCFRGSLDLRKLRSCLLVVQEFIKQALDPSLCRLPFVPEHHVDLSTLPTYVFNLEAWKGYENTKYDKNRGKKDRQFIDLGDV